MRFVDARLRFVLVVALVATNVGCATVFKGSKSTMKIAGVPEDATFETAEGAPIARTKPRGQVELSPDEVELPVKGAPSEIHVKYGKETRLIPVRRFVGRGWVGLGIFTGLLPLVIDAVTGSWYEYEDVPFEKGESPAQK